MNKKVLIGGLVVLLLVTGVVVGTFVLNKPKPVSMEKPSDTSDESESIPENTDVTVSVEKSTKEANTIIVKADGLNKKYSGVEYEISYETGGQLQGVNSGSKPIDVANQDSFERDVYLGTCSKNVCKPHMGVKTVTTVLQFTDTNGKKSQFTKDFSVE